MKKRVAVITEDRILFQKIYLILKPIAIVQSSLGGEDVCLWDADSASGIAPEGALTVSGADGDLVRPFTEEMLISLILESEDSGKLLTLGDRRAFLRGREIRLTEVEFSLLSSLVNASGEYVMRERLISEVWGEGADGGVLNVYIHYLREKLECEGEKVILSSRKHGYKINGKFIKGREE